MFSEASRIQSNGQKSHFPSQEEMDAVMQEWRDNARTDEKF